MAGDELEYKFKFAVVMAIYNTGNYLSKAIDSIINQSIGFKDNVQLILVNDGSEDNSEQLCWEFYDRYPENIVVLTQENLGQAAARNNGFKQVNAKYVTFTDSDDYLSLNAFEEVYNFFEEHFNETDIVSIPITFFEKVDAPHMLNDKFFKSRIIDLSKDPDNPQLHANSAFIKSDVFAEYEFPTNVISSEDVIAVNKILLEKKTLGVVNSAEYFYRKRYDESSTLDMANSKKEFFTDKLRDYYLHLFNYAKSIEGNAPAFLQYSLVYDLQWMLKEDLSLLSDDEAEEFWLYFNEVLSFIDSKVIVNSKHIKEEVRRHFLLFIKNKDLHTEIKDDDVLIKIGDNELGSLGSHKFWLDIVDIRDYALNISASLTSFIDPKYISIEAVKFINDVVTDKFKVDYVKYDARGDLFLLSIPFQYKYNFDVSIPITPGEISKVKLQVTYHKDGNNENFNKDNIVELMLRLDRTIRVNISDLSKYQATDLNILYFNNNSFHIIPNSFKSNVKREMDNIELLKNQLDNIDEIKNEYGLNENDLKEIIRLRTVYLMSFPFFKLFLRNKEIYLFEDRIGIADDNALQLFRYANTVKDNVKKYFVLSRESKQFREVSKIGKALAYGSFKHKLLMLHADKIITTHPHESSINPFYSKERNLRPLIAGLLNYKVYFLQHGVTKDNISSWLSKYLIDLSLITTVSEKESKSFLDEGYGYDESIIQNLGFPRFDNLEKKDNKQILIVPTWRKNLSENQYLFKDSEYFHNLNSFLNNPDLLGICHDDYKIVFKPHPELDKFIGLFDIPKEIIVSSDESYQELLNNSSILITDYSSVFFDFAYLKKPVIYYHPNEDYHYEKSYFDYKTMGFGDIAKSEREVVDKLNEYVNNACRMEDTYQERVDEFFTYTDKNNSKRVYDWIFRN
ncbi:CDP-glycerol:glycerophosphate glycerophosphotransferase [Methanobrevibacter sp.]|uniref:CDP-glycerol:glycerophosphate glycerophosphotransferase n=1 Tax=Methanobrevibacter sp. TaxID=66852 RepID=UPI003864F2A9